jgi:hypothetical protein
MVRFLINFMFFDKVIFDEVIFDEVIISHYFKLIAI